MLTEGKPFHRALPAEAQLILRRACLVQNTPQDPLAKLKAIDQANARIRSLFPSYFKPEEYPDEDDSGGE